MNQYKTPLCDALFQHIKRDPISFHVPGHKYGEVFRSAEKARFQSLLKIDATELSGLDDLHSPEGVILESEALLADLYKIKKSFFLVNGSTGGNLTMVMSTCVEGSHVLVQRNCHKSILNALKLAKVHPIFLEPEFDYDWKIATSVTPQTVKDAIALYPDAKAVILTYPNYYGMAYDLEGIIKHAHHHRIPVLVDEAHGPHFIFGEPMPKSAVQLGADLVVQSAHKLLPAMTMGSYLHFNSGLIDLHMVKEYLQIFQSSSPSYPIMASLDLARSYLATYQREDIDYILKEIQQFKEDLNGIPGIRVLDYLGKGDPLKVTIQSTCGLSGFELQRKFEEVGVFTELADPLNVLFVLPLLKADQSYPFAEAATKIKGSLKDIPFYPIKDFAPMHNNRISGLSFSYQEMQGLEKVEMPITEAIGKVAAEMIIPYPPGIPLLLVGERITQERIESLIRLIESGAKFQGSRDLKKGLINVF
ncbi:aminotransferase class I/II-fold pyridoxal phosphate-dependent enzyme [Neobacillus sp. PS3-40]|uniref:aminotransferase class I/II-fold pyridoxal phosphate-dependent enzyme n=1 Tax=Neobacillus sp. PS3-40 TaxID=3070679 RepID=UPI0027DEC5EB|nr:aminotransferase class I/II-fold pyridoxal phosphate-dependent enzyme [Neobacillus sp. PS3-40]WML42499.1 aminotransferase class I/II-fold pyridoxal phosphate-dependent enzyme [Neobacillus sp. PS3-40]